MTRYTIRPAVYCGQAGYTIRGNGGGIFGTSIFTTSRSSAEHIREQLRARDRGEDVDVATGPDFQPQEQYAHLDTAAR